MACKEDGEGCFTLTWEIQNFGIHFSLANGRGCWTPFWKTEHTGKSVWRRLRTFVGGPNIHFDVISAAECLHLDRCEVSLISSCMEVPLELFDKSSSCWSYFLKRDALFNEKRQSILPNDTLTLRFKMWEKTMETRELRINSVLHRFSYLWNIEKFRSDGFYKEYIEEENILFKAFLDSKNEKGTHRFIFGEVSSIDYYVTSSTDFIISNIGGGFRVIEIISDFPNNKNTIYEIEIGRKTKSLNLQLESVFSVHEVCQDPFKLVSQPRIKNVSEAVSGALRDDFVLIYQDKLFSDATLNVEGQSFHVHRNILSARSPVFRAMFEKDEMSEGRSGAVEIDDVDSDTVDRMLVYLYGDSLESVQQFEDATALYYAADKYDLKPLKHKCASSLKEFLTVDNACEALVLADRHSDDQLMKCIVDFICQNEEVISSEKWDSFENSKPLLSSKILRKICVKNREK